MLKTELIQRVAGMNPHLRASDAEKIVNTIFEEMMAAMARGDRVELRGIGAFTVRVRPGRPGRNPKTGKEVPILPRRVLVFRPSHVLKARVNGTADGVQDDDECHAAIGRHVAEKTVERVDAACRGANSDNWKRW